MPSRRTRTTRPQKPRKLAEGTYCIGSHLIIDGSKVAGIESERPEETVGPEEEKDHPEEVGHASHETSGKEGGPVAE